MPGSSFPCRTPNGQELDLTVPPGVPSGTLLTLTLDPATRKWSCEAEVGGGSSPSRPAATAPTSTAPLATSVVVPEGAEPGSLLRATTPEGQELDLIIPEGVRPGSRLSLTRDPITGSWTCTAEHGSGSSEQSGTADVAVEAEESDLPVSGDVERPAEPSVHIPDTKSGTSLANGDDPHTPTWGFRGDTDDLAGFASRSQSEPPPPGCVAGGHAAAHNSPTVASTSAAAPTCLPQHTPVQLQSTDQHPQHGCNNLTTINCMPDDHAPGPSNIAGQHLQQHLQQQHPPQQQLCQQDSVLPTEAERGAAAQEEPSCPPPPPPPQQPSPAQVPPRYCCAHDSSSKRTKATPRLWQCSLCGIRVQTNYADFALCALCSDKESKCMICSEAAPTAGTYIPAQRLPEMPTSQGLPSLESEYLPPGAEQQQLSYTPPPILEDCLTDLTPLPQMLPPPPPPPDTMASANPGGCNIASPWSGPPLSSPPYAPREFPSSTAMQQGPAQQMPMMPWGATAQQMVPMPPLNTFLAPVRGAQPDFGFARPKISLPGPPFGCGGPRGAGLGAVNSAHGFR